MSDEQISSYPERIERIGSRLATWEPRKRVLFAASCCERLMPCYEAFVAMEKWGDPKVLRIALDEVWKFLEGQNLQASRVEELVNDCDALAPSTVGFGSLFVSPALDCATSVIETLQCCLDGDFRHVAQVLEDSLHAIEIYLFHCSADFAPVVDGPNQDTAAKIQTDQDNQRRMDEWIHSAPLMMAEIAMQDRYIADIESKTFSDAESLHRLRQDAAVGGIQPFVRGLLIEPPS